MRVMVKFSFPNETGNGAVSSGKVGQVFERIMTEIKPEAAYFFPADGDRGGLCVINMQDSSEVALVAERFFLGLNAKVEMTPVMTAEDLQKALGGGMEAVVKNFAA